MRPLQVWLPMLGPSLGFPEVQRDRQRAQEAWCGEQVVWLTPGLKEPVRWREGGCAHLAVDAEYLDCVHIFHVGASGYVWGPASELRFPGGTVNGLLQAWCNIDKVGGVTYHPAPTKIPWRVPHMQSDQSIAYVEGIIRVAPGATVPLSRIDAERRSCTICWPPEGHPSPVSLDAESWALHGKGGVATGIQVLLERPSPLQPLASLMSGLDDLYAQSKMVEVIRKYPGGPDRVWLEAKAAADPYITPGQTTQLFSRILPTLVQEGEDGVVDELSGLAKQDFRSLHEAQRSAAWQQVITRPVPILRVWGAVGLFWALLLEKLERDGIRCCPLCGRIIEGSAQKTYCGPEDDEACFKARVRDNRRREQMHERGNRKAR
jgi:hypothetical protein